ncbi:UNVERIFIED_CONTAM: hypothetical protein GTU68_004549 [Idotea baltica]|nr:hypothetical protein [Idotea baltica]
MAHYEAKDRFRDELRPPSDCRIHDWLDRYLSDVTDKAPRLPGKTLTLSQHGVARSLSLPGNDDQFKSDIIDSYRIANGVLHNPKSDRRTTKGVFHVAEGGLPIPDDKKAVPKSTFAKLLAIALDPPADLMMLPLTSRQADNAHAWVSLLLRPVVCPAVPPFIEERSMEVRFFAPGNLVSNLDFVESIFGNAGDPYLQENDAGLDIDHWSGHTGCVILAPHLNQATKKEVGLPHISEATDRQKKDGMCWSDEKEKYNDGSAFKLTARNAEGVVVTMISDNYFGYCKKEVKTQISFATNLMGLAEEEHAGGALTFSSYDLGEDFRLNARYESGADHTFVEVLETMGEQILQQPEGHGIDRIDSDIVYVPETAYFTLNDLSISWIGDNGDKSKIKLLANKFYILPSGYKLQLVKPGRGRRWRLIGTKAQPCMCHKPCTVSGGGKSEISKMITDAIIHAPFYVNQLKEDLDQVDVILNRNYGLRFKDSAMNRENARSILSPDRSLGSVIKLLTPNSDYTDEHNDYIHSIPTEIRDLVMLVKRFYKPEWGENWRERFSVDRINGQPGHELRYTTRPVIKSYLRVGYDSDGSWRVFGLRSDFAPAQKVQMEDDITASVVLPKDQLTTPVAEGAPASLKFTHNCEYRLFQRPDDAVVRGYDHQTEKDMSAPASFLSNYEPKTREQAKDMIDDAIRFDHFTDPMKRFITDFANDNKEAPDYFVCSANPRLVDGKPSKNPRYLQTRLDLVDPRGAYVAETGLRLWRRIGPEAPLHTPVDIVCPGRRNNPPEDKIRPLCVFNPIHYLPLPEAFMEFISSMTGKSPSTTGAGSEGALTKAPFNALLPIHDLNASLISFIITGYKPFVTAAGYVGPNYRVDHDISLLVPEVWCRMSPEERDPDWLIQNGMLEPVPDVELNGRTIPGSILGFRITQGFVNRFLARIFSNPSALFPDDMLRPEEQDAGIYADGMDNIFATHQRSAQSYFNDGGIDFACPPLKALLHIMRDGEFEGKDLSHPEIRELFCRETMIESDWFQARLDNQVQSDIAHVEKMLEYLNTTEGTLDVSKERAVLDRKLERFRSKSYRQSLQGTIGRDPSLVDIN